MHVPTLAHRVLRPVSLLSALVALAVLGTAPAQGNPPEDDCVPGRLLVRFEHGTPPGLAEALIESHGAATLEVIDGIDVFVLELPETANEHAMARAFRGSPFVEFAEVDEILEPGELTPNDPSLSKQWHVTKIDAPSAWSVTTGSTDVIVAILDTGVNGAHADLSSKMVAGWNTYNENSDSSDVDGHGTKVAGTAAAATDNAIGVAGIAWSCRIMPIRISDLQGLASSSNAAQGLTWAADHGARVANVSYSFSTSSTVATAAKYFQDSGGVVTMSAGNNSTNSTAADNPYVLTVSATTSSDALSSFSNTGNLIDVAAPGSSIYTTTVSGGYGSVSGTSFSAPIVAGVAALVISANPDLSGAEAARVIRDSADDLGADGWDASFGWGRVNAARAVALATSGSTPPTEPVEPEPDPEDVDTSVPTIAILSPTEGGTVTGSASVKFSILDDVGVVKVELYVDGKLTGTSTASPFTLKWNTRKAASGEHTLLARAYDAAGNEGESAPVHVQK